MKNLIKEIDGELEKRWNASPNFRRGKFQTIKLCVHSSILKAVKRAFERTRIEKREEEKRGGDSELEYFTIGFNTALNLKSQKEKEVISLLEKVE